MAATAAISLNSVCVQYVQIRPPDGSPKRHAYFASPKESEIEDGFRSSKKVICPAIWGSTAFGTQISFLDKA